MAHGAMEGCTMDRQAKEEFDKLSEKLDEFQRKFDRLDKDGLRPSVSIVYTERRPITRTWVKTVTWAAVGQAVDFDLYSLLDKRPARYVQIVNTSVICQIWYQNFAELEEKQSEFKLYPRNTVVGTPRVIQMNLATLRIRPLNPAAYPVTIDIAAED